MITRTMVHRRESAPPLPSGERAFRLNEAKPSLGGKGEGARSFSERSGAPSPCPSPLRGEGTLAGIVGATCREDAL
jgi:hypothetical protein